MNMNILFPNCHCRDLSPRKGAELQTTRSLGLQFHDLLTFLDNLFDGTLFEKSVRAKFRLRFIDINKNLLGNLKKSFCVN